MGEHPQNHRIKDVTGQRFGKLTAIKFAGKIDPGKNGAIWLWHCDCGNEFERTRMNVGDSLRGGHIPMCRECRIKSFSKDPGVANKNVVIRDYRRSARGRNIDWRLDEKTLDHLFSANCHYCGCTPNQRKRTPSTIGEFIHQGIDRIDSELDYVPFNVVPCCKTCNYAKRGMDYLEFIAWIRLAASHLEGH